jgi:hypothetical protein
MKKVVFISSTFVDLKEQRKSVWGILKKYDVIVKGMEDFGAKSTDPLTTCLTELEQSDIYIGIIGMRFGSEDTQTQKSFTQLEYEKAIELKKDVLIYLIDEVNFKMPPALIQVEKLDKLKAFKSVLKEKHTVDTFSNSEDLISKLDRRFAELFTQKEKVLKADEYKNTQKIVNHFFLVPKAFTGREIKLKIRFGQQLKPASKAICDLFNFEFGQTIVEEIEVLHPSFDFANFKRIFIEYNQYNDFIKLDHSKEYEIFARVLFKEEKAKSITTNFKDRIVRVSNMPDDDYDGYEFKPYFDEISEGEGQIALTLKNILTS